MEELIFKTPEELIQGLKTKAFSSTELTQAYIKRTKEVEPKLKAFLSFDEDKTQFVWFYCVKMRGKNRKFWNTI